MASALYDPAIDVTARAGRIARLLDRLQYRLLALLEIKLLPERMRHTRMS